MDTYGGLIMIVIKALQLLEMVEILFMLMQQKNIVVAITALFKPKVTDRIEFIKEYIEPIFN